jgi:hypothetical protein
MVLEKNSISIALKQLLKNSSSKNELADQIYTQYPELFVTAFNNIEKNEIEKLNTAGFLYYKSVLLLDDLIDNKTSSSKADQLFLSNKLQEESIKLLTSVYGLDTTFWDLWSKRQQEYFKAIALEKKLAIKPNYKKYQQVAALKAAFGKVAIDCLHVLSKNKDEEKYTDLLQSHFHFSVALQLIDDLQDLKEDLKNKQFNWAHHQAKTILEKEGYDTKTLSFAELQKLMYLKKIATNIRVKALTQLNKSKQLAKKHKPTNWLKIIETQEKEITQAIDKINAYNQKLYAKVQLSTDVIVDVKLNIPYRLDRAKNFILKHQNENGSWFDYDTDAGMSCIWSTAFILNNLLDLKIEKNVSAKAIAFLKNNKQQNLWGYNSSTLADNDSSSFVLMVLHKQNVNISKELETYLAQQTQKGGFSTYTDRKLLSIYLNTPQKELNGWLQEHICVSAVSYYLMETLKIKNSATEKLATFLYNNQNSNELWDSYWWTSPIYATSFVIQAYFVHHTKENESITKAINGLLAIQQKDGSFIDNHKAKSPFYTALVIIALCAHKTVYDKHQKEVKRAVKWMLSQQTTDGSFFSTHALQIPNTTVIDPKKVKKWATDNSQATDIICNDFMRLFTTSTCAKALNIWSSHGNL